MFSIYRFPAHKMFWHLLKVPHCMLVSAVSDGVKAAAQPLSPMSGREFDPLSANQKPATFDDVAQQKVLSSFGVAATSAAAVDG